MSVVEEMPAKSWRSFADEFKHKPAKVRTTIPAENAPPMPDLIGRRFCSWPS